MGIPLLGLIPKIIKTAASILGVDSVKDVVDAIENNKLTPEQRIALDTAAKQFEIESRQLDLEQMKQFVAEAVAEIQSPDKFTSRARPSGLYFAYVLSALVIVAQIFHIQIDRALVAEVMLPMYGAGGYYMFLRTKEKMNGSGGE
jgi:hypothetical protein